MASTHRTRYMILGLLAGGPQTGYSIKQMVEHTISHFWKESYGHIYPSLSRLLEEGLIARAEDEAAQGRERKTYQITAAGRAVLEGWLAEDLEPEGVRNELALKLYFARAVGPAIAQRHLLAERARHRERLALYETRRSALEVLAAQGQADAVYDLITLGLGIHTSQARIAWCDQALELLHYHPGA